MLRHVGPGVTGKVTARVLTEFKFRLNFRVRRVTRGRDGHGGRGSGNPMSIESESYGHCQWHRDRPSHVTGPAAMTGTAGVSATVTRTLALCRPECHGLAGGQAEIY